MEAQPFLLDGLRSRRDDQLPFEARRITGPPLMLATRVMAAGKELGFEVQ
jgi:hypothetical protein